MPAVFEISQGENGFCQFSFIDSKGERLLMSDMYEDKALAEKAIQDVRVGSLMSQFIAKGKTPGGEMFFVVKDNSGEVIAKSVLFNDEMRFDNALHQLKDNACIAEITYNGGLN